MAPAQRALFVGDLVFRGRIPFVGQADSAHWVEALDALLAYEAQTIVPGHGPVSASARWSSVKSKSMVAPVTARGSAAR